MDKITRYKQIARNILEQVARKLDQVKDYQPFLVIDEERGQYLILHDGWDHAERTYGVVVHIQVTQDGKVWLRYDGTDLEIGQELLNYGVSPEDLVLAFLSPALRSFTPYATA